MKIDINCNDILELIYLPSMTKNMAYPNIIYFFELYYF
jgi:hypothetical protein